MTSWKSTLIPETATVRDCIKCIDSNRYKICLIVSPDNTLLGTVTDGDIRRALLGSAALDDNATKIMNRSPITASPEDHKTDIAKRMKTALIRQIPIVDESSHVLNIISLDALIEDKEVSDNLVVLMAGGMGTRLMPLTKEKPKPLLHVGGRPLLETILDNFTQHGFRNFVFTINYKGTMIKDHFKDGREWGARIRYVEEEEKLGTAGALSLLPEKPTRPVIVMNGDVLTSVDFNHLLDYHEESRAKATMCVRAYELRIPFGVIEIEDNEIQSIEEKPQHSFFVNAGIYVIDPDVLDLIPDHSAYDMTELFNAVKDKGHRTVVFPLREYWLDVGRPDDFERANADYRELFAR